jgi:hypothetical protein
MRLYLMRLTTGHFIAFTIYIQIEYPRRDITTAVPFDFPGKKNR